MAMTGGDKLMAYLAKIDAGLASAGSAPSVRVGFLEGSTEADGTSIPMIAAVNEFGGTIQREAGTVTVYRKVAASGTHFLRNGRFVKRKESNWSETHAHGAYTITIPPRPFFRNAIKAHGKEWGKNMGASLKENRFDAAKALVSMGQLIKRQIQQSIRDTNSPPNAPSTIRRKGFNKPLIDTGTMWNSVDYEVST